MKSSQGNEFCYISICWTLNKLVYVYPGEIFCPAVPIIKDGLYIYDSARILVFMSFNLNLVSTSKVTYQNSKMN